MSTWLSFAAFVLTCWLLGSLPAALPILRDVIDLKLALRRAKRLAPPDDPPCLRAGCARRCPFGPRCAGVPPARLAGLGR